MEVVQRVRVWRRFLGLLSDGSGGHGVQQWGSGGRAEGGVEGGRRAEWREGGGGSGEREAGGVGGAWAAGFFPYILSILTVFQ